MKFASAIAGALALFVMSSSLPAWSAGPAADAGQVQRQAPSMKALQRTAAKAATSSHAGVEIQSTAHQITIAVVNSKLNSGDALGRSDEAARIVRATEKAIAAKKEFGQVMIVHVDYVRREASHTDIVQGFDFNKSPSGSFVPHKT
jgi:hypothetical protein